MRYRLCILLTMLGITLLHDSTPLHQQITRAAVPTTLAADYPVVLTEAQLTLSGDVATYENTVGYCTAPWLDTMPAGSIILGVDPHSCNPSDWEAGSAVAQLQLQDLYHPTLLVLRVNWPDRDGKGIHSPLRDRRVSISLDGQPLWDKRTTQLSTFGDYYAAEHESIVTTIVLTSTAVHTIRFSVPPRTVWDIGNIELRAYPMPSAVRGIGYSPYRDCQMPGGTLQPSRQEIEEDLFRLVHTTNAIRTYAATGVNRLIPEIANKLDLPVYAGAWLDRNESDAVEAQGLIKLARAHNLAGVIVGNEFYLRHRSPADLDYLLQYIRQVRTGLQDHPVPVATAEIDGFMFDWADDRHAIISGIKPEYRPIIDELDIIMVHIYPFWNGMPIDGAAAYTINHYNAIRAFMKRTYGDQKRVIIGETGWPSGGQPLGQAIPSLENQRRYLREFLAMADTTGVDYLYFDTFDELWKIEEPGRVGQNWGYTYSDHSVKHPFNGVLIPTAHRSMLPLVISTQGNREAAPEPSIQLPANPESPPDHFPVYTEWLAEPGRFVPVGWMGDTNSMSLYECDRSDPHSGEMAIRATFSPTGTLGWGGVSWQDPASDWGRSPGGYDLTGARRLSFWVRGAHGGEVIEFTAGGIGDPTTPYHDSLTPARTTAPIVLSNRWEKVEIDLSGADLRRVVGGFSWVASRCYNSNPITFYIDDIAFEYTGAATPAALPRRFTVYDTYGSNCGHFAPSGFMGDLGDMQLDPSWHEMPSSLTTIRVDYSAQASQHKGWAGIYWQEPDGNWGAINGGFDLSWANKLTFRARGARGGEKIQFFVGGIGGQDAPYPDSLRPARTSGFVEIAPSWQTYSIDLRGANLTHIIGGFGFVVSQCADPNGATFYLDDIVFEYDPSMPPISTPNIVPVYTDAAARENHFVPSVGFGDAEVSGRVSVSECWHDNPHSGLTSVRNAYIQHIRGWAGMIWVDPAENYGQLPGGIDLSGATEVTFWARSETPNATVTFFVGGIGYATDTQGNAICSQPTQPFPDSVCPAIRMTARLSAQWQQYTINLRQTPQRILNTVIGGFGWSADAPVVFYLDDIVYEFDAMPAIANNSATVIDPFTTLQPTAIQ